MTGRARKANILLVDDHPENLLALEAVLKEPDCNIVRALSGREALRRILDQDFAVILLDVQMPDMDGFETAALIRQREKSRHTPIIFLTALSKSDNFVFKGYSYGAVDYILKPFVPNVLKAKVSVFVDLFNKTEQIREQARQLQQIERAEHQKQLAHAEDRRNRFFSLSLNLVCIVGFDGFIKELNPAWEAAIGYTATELQARPFIKIIHPDDRSTLRAAWQKLREDAKEDPIVFENRCLCKDGTHRWLLWSAIAYPQEKVYYAAARDITERKMAEELLKALNQNLEKHVEERTRELSRINEELTQEIAERKRAEESLSEQAQELRRSNSELEQFAYVASHDLREPLRKVASFAELLAQRFQGRLDPDGEGYIRYIVDGVSRMQALISDLLEYSKVGKEIRPPQAVACGPILEKTIANLSLLIQESHAAVTCDAMPTVRGNPTQLYQVFQNLIGNALKFRGEKPPAVHIGARKEDAQWVFSIKDNGIGIDPKHHERIFSMFKRLHARDKYPGTGMGLAICKKVVERHHGRIWVESETGQGATFFQPPAALGRAGMKASDKIKPAEILLVEDDSEDVLLIREALKACRAPHQLSVAQDGDEALAFLRREGRFSGSPRPQLILLDLNLPGKDGREALAEIKGDPELRRIPVIVLTTSDSEQDIVKCYDLHANGYVTKPIGLDPLVEMVRRIEDFWLSTAKLPPINARRDPRST